MLNSDRLKILLIGDEALAMYHPLKVVETTIKEAIEDVAFIDTQVNINDFHGDLDDYDGLVLYSDQFRVPMIEVLAHKLEDFVRSGGGIVLVHNGISLTASEVIGGMMGVTYLGHPPATTLEFTMDQSHPISENLKSFRLHEEPYRFDFSLGTSKDVFMTYEFQGELCESGWTSCLGRGRLVYIHPGHDAVVLIDKTLQVMLKRGVLWSVNRL